MGKLTKVGIDKLDTGKRYADGDGLYLSVDAGKHGIRRSWEFIYTSPIHRSGSGKPRIRTLGLGPYPEVTIAKAREYAGQQRDVLRASLDPLDERDRLKAEATARVQQAKQAEVEAALTFRTYADSYIAGHVKKLKNPRHAIQWQSVPERYAYPIIGDLPLAEVNNTMQAEAILAPHWISKWQTMSKLRTILEAIIGSAMVKQVEVAPKVTKPLHPGPNPFLWSTLKHLQPFEGYQHEVEHFAAMPYPDIPAFMHRLRACPDLSARLFEVTMLTVLRTNEVVQLRRSWVSYGAISVPSEFMKGRRAGREPHRIPISDALQDALDRTPRINDSDWYFLNPSTGRPLSNMAMIGLLKRWGLGMFTPHGSTRSSFQDWCSETEDVHQDVIDMCLAHEIKSKTEAAYRRGDLFAKRARLMQTWGAYCTSYRVDNVVALRPTAP